MTELDKVRLGQWLMPFWVRSALPLATEGTQECIWNLSYNERRMAIELEITKYLEEEDADALISQFPRSCGL